MKLAPSILSFDLTRLAETIPAILDLDPEVIHLDVMDGQFVPPITFGDSYVAALRKVTDAPFEVHLMTLSPERQFDAFIAAGCSRVTFHAEATAHAHRHIQALKERGVQAGLAINPGTPADFVEAVAADLDLALIMTVNPGWGGQKFLRETLPKVRQLRDRFPDLRIEVDGGIDPTTIKEAREAGADLFVVGSYFAKSSDMGRSRQLLEDAWSFE